MSNAPKGMGLEVSFHLTNSNHKQLVHVLSSSGLLMRFSPTNQPTSVLGRYPHLSRTGVPEELGMVHLQISVLLL